MEGYSKIIYKDKTIHCFDYTNIGHSKEKVIKLIKFATEEYMKLPPKSALVLVNFTNLHLDMDVLNVFKEERLKSKLYEKKIAVMGIKGVINIGYNFIVNFGKGVEFTKYFESETEAKEWLVEN